MEDQTAVHGNIVLDQRAEFNHSLYGHHHGQGTAGAVAAPRTAAFHARKCTGLELDMLPVSQLAHVHTSDYDLDRSPDIKEFDNTVNICCGRATDAPKAPTAGYTQLQCQQISD